MSTSDSAREPSMEDILASIRKIIADDPAPAAAAATDASDPEPVQPGLRASPAATSDGSDASTSPAPLSGRLADALGGLKKAATRQEPALSSDTGPSRTPSFGGLDDDLSDLLDDTPDNAHEFERPASRAQAATDGPAASVQQDATNAQTAGGIPLPTTPHASPDRAASSSPFGSSFNPPASLRPGRGTNTGATPATGPSTSTTAPEVAGEPGIPLPFGQKGNRESDFSSDSLLKASSSLLAKSPDRAASLSSSASQSDEQPDHVSATTQASGPPQPGSAPAEAKTPAAKPGPVVIAAMPPAAKSGTARPETASASAAPESEPAKGSVERPSAPRPIGFALGAGSPQSGQNALERTLGISSETPSVHGNAPSSGGFVPSLRSGEPDAGAVASNSDDEATEPILMPTVREAAANREPLGSTSALDELAAGLAASVGSVAGGFSGMKTPGEASRSGNAPEAGAVKPTSVSTSAAEPAASPSPSPSGATARTMEETVGELLRPMLREWLDANMPRIVENALRAEMSESVGKSLSSGPGVAPPANVFGTKKPN